MLAGGCFWGVEEILRGVRGVTDTEVGYAFLSPMKVETVSASKLGGGISIDCRRFFGEPMLAAMNTIVAEQ